MTSAAFKVFGCQMSSNISKHDFNGILSGHYSCLEGLEDGLKS